MYVTYDFYYQNSTKLINIVFMNRSNIFVMVIIIQWRLTWPIYKIIIRYKVGYFISQFSFSLLPIILYKIYLKKYRMLRNHRPHEPFYSTSYICVKIWFGLVGGCLIISSCYLFVETEVWNFLMIKINVQLNVKSLAPFFLDLTRLTRNPKF